MGNAREQDVGYLWISCGKSEYNKRNTVLLLTAIQYLIFCLGVDKSCFFYWGWNVDFRRILRGKESGVVLVWCI
jgi:hypothetical protein